MLFLLNNRRSTCPSLPGPLPSWARHHRSSSMQLAKPCRCGQGSWILKAGRAFVLVPTSTISTVEPVELWLKAWFLWLNYASISPVESVEHMVKLATSEAIKRQMSNGTNFKVPLPLQGRWSGQVKHEKQSGPTQQFLVGKIRKTSF